MTPERIDLFASSGLCLRADGNLDVEGTLRTAGGQDGWTVACFRAENPRDVHPDHWEVHPAGAEVVGVLTGEARLVLRAEDDRAPDLTVTVLPGTAGIVPRNRWHRLKVDGPTTLLSIVVRGGTRLEARG